MSEAPDYGRMISRHIDRLLSIFPSEKVDRVLQLSELSLGRGGVTAPGGGPVSAESASRYKEALRQNFVQSGCRCRLCREEQA
jgi:hypothetical protein